MRIFKVCLLVLAIVVFTGCAAFMPKPQQPIGEESAAVGIDVSIRSPIGLKIFGEKNQRLIFAKLEGDNLMTERNNLIESNYERKNCLYLLNAEPGRYIAVGYKYEMTDSRGRTFDYMTFFNEEVIRESEVTVEPGSIAFMGSYVVRQKSGLKDADVMQMHYAKILKPGAVAGQKGGVKGTAIKVWNIFNSDFTYRGILKKVDKSPEADEKFRQSVLKDLKESTWPSKL